MSELNDLSKDERDRLLEKARTSLAQRRPGFGVRSFAIGLGIPAITLVTLMTAAPAWRTATLWHRLIFIALVAVATGIGVIAASRDRLSAIEHEAMRARHEDSQVARAGSTADCGA